MELKIICPCGQKYKFDVEPVNGRMPWAVACPVCGVDGTAAAEQQIREWVSASPAPAQSPTLGLRVAPAHAAAVPVFATPAAEAMDSSGGVRTVTIGWKNWLWVILALLVIGYSVGSKWYRRVKTAARAIAAVTADKSEGETGRQYEWTLPSDDGLMILVRATNAVSVGQACIEYQKTKFRRALTLAPTKSDEAEDGDRFLIRPASSDCVQVDGPMSADEAAAKAFMGMAKDLSQALQTMTVAAVMGDDAETGVFGIYEKGQQVFWCEREISIANGDLKETVRTSGDDWATGKGFKPADGFAKFTMEDANDLTRRLGFKFEGQQPPDKLYVLREGAKKPTGQSR
jgi:hypothetical protein